jgi:tripartite-type tricarboxylate transporter receptor subunit TctC
MKLDLRTTVMRLAAGFLLAATGGSALLSGAAAAQSSDFVKGVLQPLPDGFPKRAITIVNPDDPGSRDGIYARSILEAVQKISPVQVILSDEPAPAFGTFYTINDIKKREGGMEGYYPIIVSIIGTTSDLTVEPITKETGLTANDMDMLVATDTIPYVVIAKKDAKWGKSFADLVKYGKEHPGELKYISNQVGSGNDLAMEWVLNELGLKVTKIPAPSNDAVAAAIGAGQGDFSMSQAGTALQHYQAGKVEVLLVTGTSVPAPWDKDSNVVTAKAAGLPDSPWGVVQGISVPKGVPKEHVDWLYKLFKAAAETEHHRKREQTVPGAKITLYTPEEANKLKMQVLEYTDPVVRALGLHIDQQKQ